MFKIVGGQDKQGFAMKQGVLCNTRVKLLMTPGDSGFRGYGRRDGERRRKSVRGCIVGQDIAVRIQTPMKATVAWLLAMG